jgi:hypothetical protein
MKIGDHMEKRRCISRVERPTKHTFGWFVRVQFGNQVRSKFFSDRTHGGRDAALEQAIRFRDRAERDLGKPRTDVRKDGERFIVGLGRGRRYIVRIDERGEKSALRRAVAIRRELERKVYGSTVAGNSQKLLGKLIEG